jgi:predicted porin
MNKKQMSMVIAAVMLSGTAAAAADDWSGILSVSVGNDDNVTLADDSNVVASGEKDNFVDVLATAGTYLTGNRDDGIRLKGTFYNRGYDTEDDFNFTLAGVGIEYQKKFGEWHGRFGAKYNYIEFGGEPYESIVSLKAEGRRKLNKNTELRIRYRYSDITAESAQFDNLEGDRHQLRVEGRYKQGKNRYRLSYRFETNDRNDTETATTFTSSSPVRHTIRANAKIPLVGKWGSEFDLRWRDSRYKDDNVAPGSSVRREDDRLKASAGLNYQLDKKTDLYADYTYTDNDSNIDSFQYERNVVSMGVNYFF